LKPVRLTTARGARALGVAILAQLAVLHLALRADAQRAFLFDYPLPTLCALRESLGLPCPTCGLTRALGLTLHGELGAAWQLFPAAPLLLLSLAAFAAALITIDWRRAASSARRATPRAFLTRATLGAGGISVVVWLVDYARRIAEATPGAS
jgi:hypothetical protein